MQKGLTHLEVRYLEELYNPDNHTEFGAPGYTKISEIIGCNRQECSKIRMALDMIGVVKTVRENGMNKNILVVKDFNTALKKFANLVHYRKI